MRTLYCPFPLQKKHLFDSDFTVKIVDVESSEQCMFQGHTAPILSVALHPQETFLVRLVLQMLEAELLILFHSLTHRHIYLFLYNKFMKLHNKVKHTVPTYVGYSLRPVWGDLSNSEIEWFYWEITGCQSLKASCHFGVHYIYIYIYTCVYLVKCLL